MPLILLHIVRWSRVASELAVECCETFPDVLSCPTLQKNKTEFELELEVLLLRIIAWLEITLLGYDIGLSKLSVLSVKKRRGQVAPRKVKFLPGSAMHEIAVQ